ncbi:hypothetical protein EZV73_00815 [Acidaminobacter sp. JC074]|uniref:hypothetical protein n=1 Tax=Acidaminobacter sp. JC074 TaxID=2530199 RepID=UPI001F115E3B|nr:hypothetical protein [Acidaminobacter sp. JC074]MCH4886082.1 hypothetical protein [Acidaminobacter sp. JC074]
MYKDLNDVFKDREIVRDSVVKYQMLRNSVGNDQKELQAYEAYMKMIQTFHRGLSGTTYQAITELERPKEPEQNRKHENLHRKQIKDFKPSLYERVFKKDSDKLKQLKDNLYFAKEKDKRDYHDAYQSYNERSKDYEELLTCQRLMEKKDETALRYWLETHRPYAEIEKMGIDIDYTVSEDTLELSVRHKDKKLIPMYEKLMVDNQVVTRKMSDKAKLEVFKNIMVSVSVRLARESFESIPVKKVIVKSYYKKIDQAVMAVAYKKEIFERLEFSHDEANKIVELFNFRSHFDLIE